MFIPRKTVKKRKKENFKRTKYVGPLLLFSNPLSAGVTDRQADRQTQTSRQTDTDGRTDRDGQTEKQTQIDRHRHRHKQADRLDKGNQNLAVLKNKHRDRDKVCTDLW